jgi:hypothetical protein
MMMQHPNNVEASASAKVTQHNTTQHIMYIDEIYLNKTKITETYSC